jgi:membrane associated rhomboid family serine protease
VLPLKDDNPTRRFPFVTVLLILANVLAFLYETLGGPQDAELFVSRLGLVPGQLVGGMEAPAGSPVPLILTPFTSMFLHASWFHLAGNMLYLWIFGNNVEEAFGVFPFLLFYVFSGLVAAMTHVLTAPHSAVPVIGASGAVAGVLGAYAVLYPQARVLTLVPFFIFIRLVWLPALLMLGVWFLFQVLEGLPTLGAASGAGGVAFFAHIGGFLAGVCVGLVHKRRSRRFPRAHLNLPFDEFQ